MQESISLLKNISDHAYRFGSGQVGVKGKVHPKKKKSVIIYSSSCPLTPMEVCFHQRNIKKCKIVNVSFYLTTQDFFLLIMSLYLNFVFLLWKNNQNCKIWILNLWNANCKNLNYVGGGVRMVNSELQLIKPEFCVYIVILNFFLRFASRYMHNCMKKVWFVKYKLRITKQASIIACITYFFLWNTK